MQYSVYGRTLAQRTRQRNWAIYRIRGAIGLARILPLSNSQRDQVVQIYEQAIIALQEEQERDRLLTHGEASHAESKT